MKAKQALSARQLRGALHDELGPQLFFVASRLTLLKDELRGRQRMRAVEILKEVETARARARQLGRGEAGRDAINLSLELRRLSDKMKYTFQDDLPKPIDDPKKAALLFQIAREAAHNAVRHGEATSVVIRLAPGNLEIRDNGSGFPRRWRSGAGMKLMRERARELRGTLTVHRVATVGTILSCHFS